MRTIQVSTEVFAAIWATRRPGEDSENDILHRVLGVHDAPTPKSQAASAPGWKNNRFKVEVPEGFRIERNFKGVDYVAVATGGSWKLSSTGNLYPNITALSEAINTGIENVWANWSYTDSEGTRRPVSDLRDPTTIRRRSI
jgi:hypothetical protein